MKITQDVRDYARAQGIAPDDAVAAGLREKAAAFREQGQALYVGDTPAGEPLIVPLAIPAIAGPAAIATVVLLVSRAPQRLPEWLAAITVAIAVSFVVLIFAERISRWLGERVLEAFERLMGLLLTAIAVEMLLRGIEGFVRHLQAG